MNYPAPFTERQMQYMSRCFNSWFNVAEGGKRGSKNVLQTYIFCKMLETHPNRLHLVAGVSSATASLNIVDCDGYGIENYFEGRYRHGKYQNRDNWDKKCIHNICHMGFFSSDRTITEYAMEI